MSGIKYKLEGVSSGPKQQGRQAYHTAPSKIKVRNRWGYTSTLAIYFCPWYL